uniref:Uncharacterized protein n=1 Tax=Acrobeloides nanus TaxID=290746 RepID=A0A914DNS7_9BILA
MSLVHHPRPCSYYNLLPLQCWSGSDAHDSLLQRDIGGPYRLLASSGYNIFLGGDLSSLSTFFGLSCAMSFGSIDARSASFADPMLIKIPSISSFMKIARIQKSKRRSKDSRMRIEKETH